MRQPTLPNSTPIVTVRNNEVFANSRDVAAFFGKLHKHVLRDIRETLRPNLDPMDFNTMFTQATYLDSTGRRLFSEDMTRDGFTLLVMGYTGAKALEFKVRYIKEFNRMESWGHFKPRTDSPLLSGLIPNDSLWVHEGNIAIGPTTAGNRLCPLKSNQRGSHSGCLAFAF